jgi:predicted RNA methylase
VPTASQTPSATTPTSFAPPTKRIPIPPAVADVLARASILDNLLVLPEQLDRKDYVAANKVLEALGAKWDRYAKGHVFPAGQPLPEELAAVLGDGEMRCELTGYFPTPGPLAEELVALAGVRAEHLVLEPSAGQGAIADLLAAIVAPTQLYLVEPLAANRAVLEGKGYRAPQLVGEDFLTTRALPDQFDRIVMNPPFERRADVHHVTHAYGLLRPGGRLAAIMSESTEYREDTATKTLRDLLEASSSNSLQRNPPDAFKQSGTTVRTITVLLEKPPSA